LGAGSAGGKNLSHTLEQEITGRYAVGATMTQSRRGAVELNARTPLLSRRNQISFPVFVLITIGK
jgi:hypothetical protein